MGNKSAATVCPFVGCGRSRHGRQAPVVVIGESHLAKGRIGQRNKPPGAVVVVGCHVAVRRGLGSSATRGRVRPRGGSSAGLVGDQSAAAVVDEPVGLAEDVVRDRLLATVTASKNRVSGLAVEACRHTIGSARACHGDAVRTGGRLEASKCIVGCMRRLSVNGQLRRTIAPIVFAGLHPTVGEFRQYEPIALVIAIASGAAQPITNRREIPGKIVGVAPVARPAVAGIGDLSVTVPLVCGYAANARFTANELAREVIFERFM